MGDHIPRRDDETYTDFTETGEVNVCKNKGAVKICGAITSLCFPKDDAGGLSFIRQPKRSFIADIGIPGTQ